MPYGGSFACLAIVALWPVHAQDIPVKINRGASEILVDGTDWELLGEGYHLTADSAVDNLGNVYFTDAQKNRILKIDLEGKIHLWKEGSNGSHGIAFGPDGRLYAGQHDRKRIVAFSVDGTESVIAEEIQTHHLMVTARRDIYYTEAPRQRVSLVDATGRERVVHEGLKWPRGICVSGDQAQLAVNDARTNLVWFFEIQNDGSLINRRPAYQLESSDGSGEADAGGMTFDSEGLLYVATKFGVQVLSKQGRVTAMINAPGSDGLSNVLFAGPDLKWLYVMDGNRIYRRPVRRQGVKLFRQAPQP